MAIRRTQAKPLKPGDEVKRREQECSVKALQNRNEIISTERIPTSANPWDYLLLPTRGKKKKKKRWAQASPKSWFGDTFWTPKKCPQLKADSQNATTGAQGGQLAPAPAERRRREFKIQPGSEPPSQLKWWGGVRTGLAAATFNGAAPCATSAGAHGATSRPPSPPPLTPPPGRGHILPRPARPASFQYPGGHTGPGRGKSS